jgi:hypothetical protein
MPEYETGVKIPRDKAILLAAKHIGRFVKPDWRDLKFRDPAK